VLYIVHFTAFCLGGPFFSGHGVDCVDIASRSSARGRQTTLRWQNKSSYTVQYTQLLRAYLALA